MDARSPFLQQAFPSSSLRQKGLTLSQWFFLNLLFLNNHLKINVPKGTFWGGKTLDPFSVISSLERGKAGDVTTHFNLFFCLLI